jgi:hypothetical protein
VFPPLHHADGTPNPAGQVGRLRVLAGPARVTATAGAVGAPFALPPGARARLIQPGAGERLRVALDAALPPAVATALRTSPRLTVLPPRAVAEAEVWVRAAADGGWVIGNRVESEVATAAPADLAGLQRGLEAYYDYQRVLRLAADSQDPQLANTLSLTLLDCNGPPETLAAVDLANPRLPEAPRDADRIYQVPAGYKLCVQLRSTAAQTLYVTLLDCSAAGSAAYLNTIAVRPNERALLWRGDGVAARTPFEAWPELARGGTDRLVAIATTQPGVDLRSLEVPRTVQAAIALGTRDIRRPAPVALNAWTALVVPVRIGAQGTP